MEERTVAVAGGSGFIGRAIVRRLAAIETLRIRVLSRSPESARQKLSLPRVEFLRADVAEPSTLTEALKGADAVVNAVQFEGYPVENPRRGLTFEQVDFGGTVAMLKAAKDAGARQFVYISGAAADEESSHPGFRAKGKAERAIRESGLDYTIFRPSLVYGPEDRVMNMMAKALRYTPVFTVPGTGKQKLQPLLVDDLAACVALSLAGKGKNGIYEIGGPDLMSFDDLIELVMEITGYRRLLVHVPEGLMRAAGTVGEMLPTPVFSRDAVTFVTADNVCDTGPLTRDFGVRLTPAREGLAYLSSPR